MVYVKLATFFTQVPQGYNPDLFWEGRANIRPPKRLSGLYFLATIVDSSTLEKLGPIKFIHRLNNFIKSVDLMQETFQNFTLH
jgi:hypothetical protein